LACGLRAAQASKTENIKIAPPVGSAHLEKRISFAFFEPFNFIFSEARANILDRKNLCKIQIPEKKSAYAHSVDPWFVLYKSLKNILPLLLV
jgi:hypothetical protein